MLILCVESSSDPTVIGVVRESELLAERVLAERDRLAAEVEQMLRDLQLAPRELEAIAVGIGPGSFTGLRVSLAFAKGVARALSIPIWPVSSLKIIAANCQNCDGPIAVISPARRAQAHLALFHGRTHDMISAASIVTYTERMERLPPDAVLIGPGVAKLEDSLRRSLDARIPADPEQHRPHALALARLAAEAWKGLPAPDIGTLAPEYGLDFPA